MLTNYAKWPLESRSTTMPNPPQLGDGVTDCTMDREGLVESAAGMILEMVPHVVPANRAFTLEELERRIAAHAERVAQHPDPPRPRRAKDYSDRSPPMDLKLVNCAYCGRSLLGESQEPLRLTKYKRYTLPPKVAARKYGGRPYCERCVDFNC